MHLGAMPAARGGGDRRRPASPEVSWILNDPFAGGTHLPDITVITPAFHERRLVGFAVSRAHHADVGGRLPGSMPADSRRLQEEGVVISPQVLDEDSLVRLTGRDAPAAGAPRGPARAAGRQPGRVRPPVRARRGARAPDGLREATDAVLDYCERRTRACLAALPDGVRSATDVLEAGEAGPAADAAGGGARRWHDARLQRQRRAARGQPQLPARGDPLGLPVRAARADRSRHPADGRRLPAAGAARAGRLPAERPPAAPPWRRATSRPPRGWRTSC